MSSWVSGRLEQLVKWQPELQSHCKILEVRYVYGYYLFSLSIFHSFSNLETSKHLDYLLHMFFYVRDYYLFTHYTIICINCI